MNIYEVIFSVSWMWNAKELNYFLNLLKIFKISKFRYIQILLKFRDYWVFASAMMAAGMIARGINKNESCAPLWQDTTSQSDETAASGLKCWPLPFWIICMLTSSIINWDWPPSSQSGKLSIKVGKFATLHFNSYWTGISISISIHICTSWRIWYWDVITKP